MDQKFTALIRNDGEWWIGWVAEIPGVVAQETSRDVLIQTLNTALGEALDHARTNAQKAAPDFELIPLNEK